MGAYCTYLDMGVFIEYYSMIRSIKYMGYLLSGSMKYEEHKSTCGVGAYSTLGT